MEPRPSSRPDRPTGDPRPNQPNDQPRPGSSTPGHSGQPNQPASPGGSGGGIRVPRRRIWAAGAPLPAGRSDPKSLSVPCSSRGGSRAITVRFALRRFAGSIRVQGRRTARPRSRRLVSRANQADIRPTRPIPPTRPRPRRRDLPTTRAGLGTHRPTTPRIRTNNPRPPGEGQGTGSSIRSIRPASHRRDRRGQMGPEGPASAMARPGRPTTTAPPATLEPGGAHRRRRDRPGPAARPDRRGHRPLRRR